MPQLAVVPLGRAGRARLTVVVDRHLTKSDPRKKALHEAAVFGQPVQRLHGAAAQKAEISHVGRDRHMGKPVHDPVESVRCGALEPSLARARAAPHLNQVGALSPSLHHFRDEFGRVLQICVNQHHGLAQSQPQAGRHGRLLAEVSAQSSHGHGRLAGLQRRQHCCRAVRAAVVHVDNLPAYARVAQDLHQPAVQRRKCLFLIENGDDDRQRAPPCRPWGWGGHHWAASGSSSLALARRTVPASGADTDR